jgi:hypothetical protein
VVVRFGPKCEPGFLSVFGVSDEKEARELLTLACPTDRAGQFYARELAQRQDLDTLAAFSARLKHVHDTYLVPRGRCRCKAPTVRRKTVRRAKD